MGLTHAPFLLSVDAGSQFGGLDTGRQCLISQQTVPLDSMHSPVATLVGPSSSTKDKG